MKHLFGGFYDGKTVFVTGHSGFKGSWLTLWLRNLGSNVVGYSKDIRTTLPLVCDDECNRDICDIEALRSAISDSNPDLIFHLAAQPLVRESFRNPMDTVWSNVMGTVNLLEVLREQDQAISTVIVTSDKVYKPNGADIMDEQSSLGGNSIYAASKACVELLVNAWRFNYNMPLVTVRAGNVIGGGDMGENRLLPDCLRALQNRKPIIIRNPDHTRPFQHVLDCLQGYLLAGQYVASNPVLNAFNFSPDKSASVVEVVQLVLKYWGGGTYQIERSGGPHEESYLNLDSEVAKTVLNWKSLLSLEEAVKWTVDYWRCGNPEKQIYDYVQRAVDAEWAADPNWLSNLTP